MFTLNQQQEYVASKAVEWFLKSDEMVFQYDGGPGTGKSVVLNEIVRRLQLDPLTEVAAMSFIGSASLVMRMKGLINAKTAHSWIYNIHAVDLRDSNGNIIMDELLNVPIKIPRFVPVEQLDPNIKLIIIDEGYSMPMKLRATIEKFGIKILVCGDQRQLPPVNDEPAFLASGKIYHLTECMRQVGVEDISFIANRVGNGLPLLNGYYGNSIVIDADQLTDDMLLWADAVICGTNKTRDYYNEKIRRIKGYNTPLPQYGEKVVCRANNWLEGVNMDNGYVINLTNGLIGHVLSAPDVSSFDGKLFSMTFAPDLAPNAVFENTRVNYKHMISNNEIRIKIRNNKYEVGNMFEFAYAITTYTAQGQQFHNVVYIEENMHPSIRNASNLVGASRADQCLIYVKQSKQKWF